MGRPNRIHLSGAWYWVSNRIMPGKQMFKNEMDYGSFLGMMECFFDRYEIEIHSYCLLSTEYHFILRTLDTNLPEAMRHIQSIYTQHWNRRWDSAGPLFRGRYHATLFQGDRFLLDLCALAHSIPEHRKIVDDAAKYRWSSYASYVSNKGALNNLSMGKVNSQLNLLGINAESYFASDRWHYLKYLLDSKKRPSVLGDAEFKHGLLESFAADDLHTHSVNDFGVPEQLDKVLDSVSDVMSVKRKALFVAKRGQLNIPRMMAIYLSHSKARLSLNELANEFGMNHYSSASSAMQRYQKLRAREGRIQRLESEVLRRLEL